MIRVEAVKTKKDLTSFIDFPHELYAGDSNYVPELFIAQRDLLSPGKHPFHEHSSLQCFLAYDEKNKLKGRIAAIDNKNHNTFNKVNDGFFGFFDCVNDKEVANALLDKAKEWLKEKKLSTMIGPAKPSTSKPTGSLVEGFAGPIMVDNFFSCNHSFALSSKALATSLSFTQSKNPKNPSLTLLKVL